MRDGDERSRLAERLATSWERGASRAVWYEALDELDAGHADAAYRSLLTVETKAPTVARFLAEYHRLRAQHPPEGCDRCEGTGYVETTPVDVFDVHGEFVRRSTRVVNCSCPLGRASWNANAS